MQIYRISHWALTMTATASVLFFLSHLYLISGGDFGPALFFCLFAVVALSPIFVSQWMSSRIHSVVGQWLLFGVAVVVFGAGGFLYYDALFVKSGDALNGIVFFFYPPIQIIVIAIAFGIAQFIERCKPRGAA